VVLIICLGERRDFLFVGMVEQKSGNVGQKVGGGTKK
jgi:hypothetical protein